MTGPTGELASPPPRDERTTDEVAAPGPPGVSWMVGPFVLACMVVGQIVADLIVSGALAAGGIQVRSIDDIPPVLRAALLPLKHLAGGALAMLAIWVTTRRDDPTPMAFGRLRARAIPWALLVAPCAAILAADLSSLAEYLLPQSEAERELYRSVFFPKTAAALAFATLGTIVVAPVLEELIFRGGLRRGLSSRYGSLGANGLTALLFAVAHQNLRGGPIFFALGYGNALLAQRTGSLALPVLMHTLYNATFYVAPPEWFLPPQPSFDGSIAWPIAAAALLGLVVGILGLARATRGSDGEG